MTTVQPTSAGAPVSPALAETLAPEAPLGGLDLATQVMALRSSTRHEREDGARGAIQGAASDRRAQVEARLEAMQKAEAERESAGFWGEIGGVFKAAALSIAVVAGFAGTVFTGGASAIGAAVLVAALTAAPFVLPVVADHVGRALDLDSKAMMWLRLGVALACIVLAAVNPAGGASAIENAAGTADTIASVGSGAATVVASTHDLAAGQADACAERHHAGQVRAQADVDFGLEQMQAILEEAARTNRIVMGIAERQNECAQSALRA